MKKITDAATKPDKPAIIGLFMLLFSKISRVGMPIIIQPIKLSIVANEKIDSAANG